MKYFNPSYWFKLWLLSAPLFNDKTQGINAKSIDNQNIKDWASNNTTNISLIENQELTLSNNQTNLIIKPQNDENIQSINNLETDHFYENFLKTQGWSRDPQIAQQQLQEIQEEHHDFLKKEHEERKRYKRQNNDIFEVTNNLTALEDNPIPFFNNLNRIVRNELTQQGLISRMRNRDNSYSNSEFYFINENTSYNYFSININIEARVLRLFFRRSDLYLQGFIADNTYSYFSDSDLTNPNIQNITPNNLYFSGSYTSLRQHDRYSWRTIYNDLQVLANPESTDNQIRESATGVILATAESLRFRTIRNAIINSIYRQTTIETQSITVNLITNSNENPRSWNTFFQPIVTSWSRETQNAITHFNQNDNLYEFHISQMQENRPIILIFSIAMLATINQCSTYANSKVCVKNDKFCKINTYFINKDKELFYLNCDSNTSQKVNIKGKVTSIQLLDQNTKGNLKAGDIYVGTTNGFYLIHSENVYEEDNFYGEEVTSIKNFAKDKFYATKKDGSVYFLKTYLVGSELKLIGEKQLKMESSDLNKELKLYYYSDKRNEILSFSPTRNVNNDKFYQFSLKKINPVDNYAKLQFLGDVFSNGWGVKTEWGSWIYDSHNHKADLTKDIYTYMTDRANDFHRIVENTPNELSRIYEKTLQRINNQCGNTCCERLDVNQRFGLTWHWKNDNYYFRTIFKQYCEWWCSSSSLTSYMKIGNGIRLYNDDNNLVSLNKDFQNRKELNLLFNKDNSSFISKCDFKWESKNKCCELKTINLEKNNPLNYQKIKFLNVNEKIKSNWGGKDYLFKELNEYDFMKNKNIEDIIVNTKVNDNTDEIFDKTKLLLEEKNDSSGFAGVSFDQRLGLSWYWENDNYYLQTLICQRGESFWLGSGGTLSADLGKGIKLYNDEWNNDFSKSINNEQNLLIINNTNFVKSNITSL